MQRFAPANFTTEFCALTNASVPAGVMNAQPPLATGSDDPRGGWVYPSPA
jgi:hypothetical protein